MKETVRQIEWRHESIVAKTGIATMLSFLVFTSDFSENRFPRFPEYTTF
ncbi:hypothetical protein H4S14_001170 [Agrobacterium vitis]|nr:hypothetical protein [Agrobacterium vitis]MBE1437439.1 hypothetical protein [Agrobacterium vitis]